MIWGGVINVLNTERVPRDHFNHLPQQEDLKEHLPFFVKFLILKNWSIIALQCCVGLCYTTM